MIGLNVIIMTINGSFRFHPIGQGLFYSGIIKSSGPNKSLSFVYDCGTESNRDFLRKEIDDFKKLLSGTSNAKRKTLDLLVLSHFHDDHVNGLEYLLQDVTVDTVVIPYMEEDLVLLARLESKKTEAFLDDFYLDAISWLASHGVRRILVTGAENYGGSDTDDQYWDANNNNYDERFYISQNEILFRKTVGTAEVWYLRKEATVNSKACYWKFSFGNIEIPRMQPYVDAIEEFMNSHLVTISEILKSKELTDKLKRRIRDVIPNGRSVNQTSILLKHGPNDKIIEDFIKCYRFNSQWGKDYLHNCCTILTGDIDIKDKKDEQILSVKPRISVILQIPHHGSSRTHLLFDEEKDYLCSVISYGISNKYGHPSSVAIHHYRNIVLVNEREAFDYYIMI